MMPRTKKSSDDRLTLSVKEYCTLTGEGEAVVREDIRLNRIPHVLSGKRPLIRILRIPALQRLGVNDGSDHERAR